MKAEYFGNYHERVDEDERKGVYFVSFTSMVVSLESNRKYRKVQKKLSSELDRRVETNGVNLKALLDLDSGEVEITEEKQVVRKTFIKLFLGIK